MGWSVGAGIGLGVLGTLFGNRENTKISKNRQAWAEFGYGRDLLDMVHFIGRQQRFIDLTTARRNQLDLNGRITLEMERDLSATQRDYWNAKAATALAQGDENANRFYTTRIADLNVQDATLDVSIAQSIGQRHQITTEANMLEMTQAAAFGTIGVERQMLAATQAAGMRTIGVERAALGATQAAGMRTIGAERRALAATQDAAQATITAGRGSLALTQAAGGRSIAAQRTLTDVGATQRERVLQARGGAIQAGFGTTAAQRGQALLEAGTQRSRLIEDAARSIGGVQAGAAARGLGGSVEQTEAMRIGREASRDVGIVQAQLGTRMAGISEREAGLAAAATSIEAERATGLARDAATRAGLDERMASLTAEGATRGAQLDQAQVELVTRGDVAGARLDQAQADLLARGDVTGARLDQAQVDLAARGSITAARLGQREADVAARGEMVRSRLHAATMELDSRDTLFDARSGQIGLERHWTGIRAGHILQDARLEASAAGIQAGAAEVDYQRYLNQLTDLDHEIAEYDHAIFDAGAVSAIAEWSITNMPDVPDYEGAARASNLGNWLTLGANVIGSGAFD